MQSNTFSNSAKFEFHISKEIRQQYNMTVELFSLTGNLLFTNQNAIKELVYKINNNPELLEKISYGQLNAAGLLDEVFHCIFRYYEEKINPGIFQKLVKQVSSRIGMRPFKVLLQEFVEKFPPFAVYKNLQKAEDYLNSKMYSKTNLEVTIEELILLHIDNFNPANKKVKFIFDENLMSDLELYRYSIHQTEMLLKNEKPINGEDLISFIKKPILLYPDSAEQQLNFVLENWKEFLPNEVFEKLLKGRDVLREEIGFVGFGEAPTLVPKYKVTDEDDDEATLGRSKYKFTRDSQLAYLEYEHFTQDIHWMPQVVLLAKNTYVWLDQLSKKYERVIRRLDQVPDEELDILRKWNVNSLWLIGVWERSSASRKIKNIMGNPDAVSSAYSVYDYQIANDLGGEEAYRTLNEKCLRRGIRLASDMVPNHTGVYSKWVIEHPEYFIQSDTPPYPNYSFHGIDLSENPDVSVQIEDGYFNHSDAAVVFKRVDKRTGEVKFIYHGNDGTNMPWNDTAQLNLLKENVREAVIEQIFDVARRFSIIRFDAAMTLAKKHFQRLWYPLPGTGGDIPSRSESSLKQEEFDRWFPKEFWREVVDRINEKMPDTLLLAEAFWLMEGYFVRTLGMHRVYNSAFMHMLMREENSKYKELIKNTLEFEPEILKRYVNFMSNPDEETAIKQFGTGDKYFGICMLMVTLPGMPMFAHGQVEGYTEKYGMEYPRAYYNEQPNEELVSRHEKEIFPLTARRFLFSEVVNFWYFDFFTNGNIINDNVFAYSNYYNDKKALVLYNNKYDSTSGYIKTSTQKLVKRYENKSLQSISLNDALSLKKDKNVYYVFRDYITGLEYLLNGFQLEKEGFHFELRGFEYKVFLDFREIYDATGELEKLYYRLEGKPVHSIQYEFEELKLEDILKSVNEVLNEHYTHEFIKSAITEEYNETETSLFISNFNNSIRYLFYSLDEKFGISIDNFKLLNKNERYIKAIKSVNAGFTEFRTSFARYFDCFYPSFRLSAFGNYHENSLIYLITRVLYNTKQVIEENLSGFKDYLQDLHLNKHLAVLLRRTGRGEWEINEELKLINLLVSISYMLEKDLLDEIKDTETNKIVDPVEFFRSMLDKMLENETLRNYLNVNVHNDITYYRKENFEEFIDWLFSLIVVKIQYDIKFEEVKYQCVKDHDDLVTICRYFMDFKALSNKAEYRLEVLQNLLK